MPTQLSKLALVNTSDLTETLLFSVVQEGAAEASRQVISIEPNVQVIENNREIITSKNYNITVTGVYSQSAKAQLFTWADARTNLVFTGYGLDGSILQMEGTLQINKGFEDNMSFRFSSMREAKGGYDSTTGKHTAEMSYCKNGLALYGWQEGSTSGLAAGWSTDFETTSFNSGTSVQGLQESISNGASMYRDIHFPFPAKSLTFSINVTVDTDLTGALIGIQCYDENGSTTGVQATQSITGTGVVQVSKTLVAACEYVRVSVEGDIDADFGFKEPTLQLSTDYGFVEFNT